MKIANLRTIWAMALIALTSATAHAEDIDIYQGISTGGSANLLVILDNAAAADAKSTYTCNVLTPSGSGLGVNDPT